MSADGGQSRDEDLTMVYTSATSRPLRAYAPCAVPLGRRSKLRATAGARAGGGKSQELQANPPILGALGSRAPRVANRYGACMAWRMNVAIVKRSTKEVVA